MVIQHKTKLIFSSVIFCMFAFLLSGPAQPLFYKWFVPFPELKNTVIYKGTLEVVGKENCSKGKCKAPTYYVVNETGKHEIYWWLPGDRFPEYEKSTSNGATGVFWFHPDFGVIQQEIIFHKTGIDPGRFDEIKVSHLYDEYQDLFENHFNFRKYFTRLLPALAFLLLAVYCLIKAYRLNKINNKKE